MPNRGVQAQLSLRFYREAEQSPTRLQVIKQEPPLRVVRGFEQSDGSLLVHLHNLSGGVLGGDQLGLSIQVDANAWAQVTTTGSTRVYQHRPEEPDATQITTLNVEPGGLLEYLPDTLIPYANARYRQRTVITLAKNAGLFAWEIVTPGREARGESMHYNWLRMEVEICAEGTPIVSERMTLEPAKRPLVSLARLGPYRYFGSFTICRTGLLPARWLELEAQLAALGDELSVANEILWGISTLPAHGLIVRAVSLHQRTIQQGFLRFWQIAKRELYQAEAIPPRKIL